jgi:hypothetical protein
MEVPLLEIYTPVHLGMETFSGFMDKAGDDCMKIDLEGAERREIPETLEEWLKNGEKKHTAHFRLCSEYVEQQKDTTKRWGVLIRASYVRDGVIYR